MEYQKLINTSHQLSKFRTKIWIEINDQSRGVYNVNSDLVKGRITVTGAGDDAAARQTDDCVPFVNCKSEVNNTEIDNAKDINIVMPMYNLIEYSDNYSKTSGSLWQYYRDQPNDNLTNSESFKSKKYNRKTSR